MNLTIIDTSSLIFGVCHYVSKSDKPDDFAYCKQTFKEWFNTILIDTKADYYLAFTDEATNWRKEMFPLYKADRKKQHIQFLYELKKWAINEFKIYSHSKLESDDLVLLYYNYYQNLNKTDCPEECLKYDCVIASPDSDLRQISATFYNYGYRRGNKEPFETITNKQASYNLWFNILKGGHNGYKGLEGCGETYSTNYLNKCTFSKYNWIFDAFVLGIDKELCGKNIKGLGLLKGTIEFYNNFMTSYLLRAKEECEYLGINFEYDDYLPISTKELLNNSVTNESKEFEY